MTLLTVQQVRGPLAPVEHHVLKSVLCRKLYLKHLALSDQVILSAAHVCYQQVIVERSQTIRKQVLQLAIFNYLKAVQLVDPIVGSVSCIPGISVRVCRVAMSKLVNERDRRPSAFDDISILIAFKRHSIAVSINMVSLPMDEQHLRVEFLHFVKLGIINIRVYFNLNSSALCYLGLIAC